MKLVAASWQSLYIFSALIYSLCHTVAGMIFFKNRNLIMSLPCWELFNGCHLLLWAKEDVPYRGLGCRTPWVWLLPALLSEPACVTLPLARTHHLQVGFRPSPAPPWVLSGTHSFSFFMSKESYYEQRVTIVWSCVYLSVFPIRL